MIGLRPRLARLGPVTAAAAFALIGLAACADQNIPTSPIRLNPASRRPAFNVIPPTLATAALCPEGPAGTYTYSITLNIPAMYTVSGTTGSYSPADLATVASASFQTITVGTVSFTIPASNSGASCQTIGTILQNLNFQNPVDPSIFQDPLRFLTITQTGAPAGTQLDSILTTEQGGSDSKFVAPTTSATIDINFFHGAVASFWNSVPQAPPACTIPSVTISNTSWNQFNIPSGTSPVVWVHAHIGKPSGVPTTTKTTVLFTGGVLTLNGTPYSLPDGLLTFDPSAPATPTTTYDLGTNRWLTTLNPSQLSDEIFFTGAAIPVTPSVAAGAKATWSFSVQSSAAKLSFQWQWSAAVYTFWPADWNAAQILPFHNGDHAGTPLNVTVQKSLIQGPRGGGGSNFTGSWSATGTGSCQ